MMESASERAKKTDAALEKSSSWFRDRLGYSPSGPGFNGNPFCVEWRTLWSVPDVLVWSLRLQFGDPN